MWQRCFDLIRRRWVEVVLAIVLLLLMGLVAVGWWSWHHSPTLRGLVAKPMIETGVWLVKQGEVEAGRKWLDWAEQIQGFVEVDDAALRLAYPKPYLEAQVVKYEALVQRVGGVELRYRLVELLLELQEFERVEKILEEIDYLDPNGEESQKFIERARERISNS